MEVFYNIKWFHLQQYFLRKICLPFRPSSLFCPVKICNKLWRCFADLESTVVSNTLPKSKYSLSQVQAIGMYGAAQPDFFKSETT